MEPFRRRSVRLSGYDYSSPGAYFVTICSWNKECVFGRIVDGVMVLNSLGILVEKEWWKTALIRKYIEPDECVVMPNHFHGIIVIKPPMNFEEPNCRGVSSYAPTPTGQALKTFKSPGTGLGSVVRGFKSAVTKQINLTDRSRLSPIWQRNYYERIIRDENELNEIRKYIRENPAKWNLDKYYL